jgi:acetoin utilization deacetylase AcuC-like enzyme
MEGGVVNAAPVVYSERYFADLHGHIFPIEKYAGVVENLLASGRLDAGGVLEPEPAAREDLLLVHTPEYLRDLFGLVASERTSRSEMALDEAIVRAFVLQAGGTVLTARRALACGAALNLGGGLHHAFADHAEGFCYVNDVAVAARCVQRDGAARRILVVDCDVHQGNGTAHIFRRDASVTTFSIHQENNYPMKERSDLDIGLPDFTRDGLYLNELRRALDELFARDPYDLVFYLAGADPFSGDRLGGLALTRGGLRERDRLVIEHCRRDLVPLAVVLAGGYAERLEDTVAIHTATAGELLDRTWPAGQNAPS